jgi:pilus assembly protein CpaF
MFGKKSAPPQNQDANFDAINANLPQQPIPHSSSTENFNQNEDSGENSGENTGDNVGENSPEADESFEKFFAPKEMPRMPAPSEIDEEIMVYTNPKIETQVYNNAKKQVYETLLQRFNFRSIRDSSRAEQIDKINNATTRIIAELSLPLNSAQVDLMKVHIVDDALGFGPLEKILNDPEISDIMINTSKLVYVETRGKIFRTDLTFSSEMHLIGIIQKIVSRVGRRVDEASPMVDARMPDGSRFNAIIPPLALDGALVSIRKFKRDKLRLEEYISLGSINEQMYKFLKVCSASRLNVLISGGTGSGKTTLLNALSAFIDVGERVITIEDAAELQLKQPHVLRLETRPPNIEGAGAIDQRQLLKNALRMRPDRIILGEIRGNEVIDVLQAMNTGHEGSMATIHANTPRDCLTRLENLLSMSSFQMSMEAMRKQVADTINLIVQIARMRDGRRRITNITEVIEFEDGKIKYADIFHFKPGLMGEDGVLHGEYIRTDHVPTFSEQVYYFGLLDAMNEALGIE